MPVAVFFLLFCLRMKNIFVLPQFFLEDGTVFFAEAYNDGFRTVWRPYAGYFVFYQRLAAWGLSGVPPQSAPLLYFLFALCVVFYLFAVIFASRLEEWKKYLFASVVLFLPFEALELATLVNSQWVWALVLLYLIGSGAESKFSSVGIALLFVVGALSGPFVLMLLPFAAANILLRSGSRSTSVAVLAAVASSAHLIVVSELIEPRAPGVFSIGNPFWPPALEMLFGYPLYLFTAHVPSRILHSSMAALLVLLWGLLVALSIKKREVSAIMFLGAGMVFAVAALVAYRLDPETLIYRDRYALVPTAAFAWAVIALLPPRGRSRLIFLLVPLFFAGIVRFFSPALPDLAWTDRSECLGGPERCVIPLHWTGKFIQYDPAGSSGSAGRPGRIENVSGPRGAELYRQQENALVP